MLGYVRAVVKIECCKVDCSALHEESVRGYVCIAILWVFSEPAMVYQLQHVPEH